MIKAILLDWGQVFNASSNGKDKKLDVILSPYGLTWKQFHPIWTKFYILRSSGKIKTDKEFGMYIKRVTQNDIPVEELIKAKIDGQFIPKENIKVVRELKKKYKVGILSNHVDEWIKQTINNYKIENLFDSLTISSAVGERKPHAKIYYDALRKLSVKPEEAVFVADEVAEDLVAASGLGMKTIWFNTSNVSKEDRDILRIYNPDAVVKSFKEIINVVRGMQ
jgi:HAD superfamily hydrolase (TIGR01549 family)